ncbi:MAG: bifunctional phosphopantothenoylcysteine decarboxylase/phosphopantothenate--cysteine ligase CoaBC [Ktedonobacterales bacterium]|nr:bifunctional phosphopantothenoylcysteine decarboxylase/phosphopantothenate--cysteine ligase CoaBC [Ktedonobacterales bacterium]
MSILSGARIIVGVAGGIAAYKAADLVSKLTQAGALVDVVMTERAREFVAPLTFSALSQRPVWADLWEPTGAAAARHIDLGRAAQLILVAPATANVIARLAHGMADDMLTAIALASSAPLVIAPAMETHMLAHPATVANLATLRERGAHIVPAEPGRLASGEVGTGRLPSTATLLGAARLVLGSGGDLQGRRVVVTAGGTQEAIDPVRFIGNHSSGRQGFALAEVARDRGAAVTLIAGVTALATPYGVTRIDATTAATMRDAVLAACVGADALVMSAAVADFAPDAVAEHKIKKREVAARDGADMTLRLRRTPDILSELDAARGQFPGLVRVGFAAETRAVQAAARDKLARKGLDLVVANDVSQPASGFGSPTNAVWLVRRNGELTELPLLPKETVAEHIWDEVVALLPTRAARA